MVTVCNVALVTVCSVALITVCSVALVTVCSVALITVCSVALITIYYYVLLLLKPYKQGPPGLRYTCTNEYMYKHVTLNAKGGNKPKEVRIHV